jgi:hypothetical protein
MEITMKPEPLIISPKSIGSTSEVGNPTITIENIVNAMDVIGFQDQGREKVAEVIQDKFQDLVQGNIDVIPPELFELTDTIMTIVDCLSKIST